ncbi:hypothetical protein [Sporosarcina thermotolerans]|uniref:hypothetical protein n=1 Tax=Sporosarcina thermotolerans TaxID=633404 RepID=UPI0032190770
MRGIQKRLTLLISLFFMMILSGCMYPGDEKKKGKSRIKIKLKRFKRQLMLIRKTLADYYLLRQGKMKQIST